MGRLVFALTLGIYLWTAAPSAGWLDSSELAAASATLGVAHPPGEPIPTLLGRAAMFIPVGDAYFRINLASAVAAAVAAWLLYVCALHLGRRAGLLGSGAEAIAAAVAVAFALCEASWIQAVRAEVYAVEAALCLAVLAAALRSDETRQLRALLACALAAGLALATHHYVTLLVVVPVLATVVARRAGPGLLRKGGWVIACGALGVATFLYIPLRAARDPLVNWGDATTAGRLFWTVSARAFQKSLGPERHPPLGGELANVSSAVVEQVGAILLVAAALGAYLLLRRRETRRAGLLFLAAAACGIVGRAVLGFDFDNPDALGYLLPAIASVYLLGAAGLAGLTCEVARRVRSRNPSLGWLVPAAAAVLATAAALLGAIRAAPACSHRSAYAGETWGRAVLEPLPPGTLLVTGYHETMFQLWALRAVEDARPDVTLLDRNYLTHPFAPAQARRRHPELAALIDAPLRGGSPLPVAALTDQAALRPVAIELSFNLSESDPALPHMVLRGPLAWFWPEPVAPDARDRAEAFDATRAETLTRRITASSTTADRGGADRLLLLRAFLAARFYCTLARRQAAEASFDDAWRLAPGDQVLIELDRRCKLGRTLRP